MFRFREEERDKERTTQRTRRETLAYGRSNKKEKEVFFGGTYSTQTEEETDVYARGLAGRERREGRYVWTCMWKKSEREPSEASCHTHTNTLRVSEDT